MADSEAPEDKTSDLLRSMQFPSDQIKARDLIDRYPSEFDWDLHKFCHPNGANRAFEDLMNAMHLEREIAVRAAEGSGYVDAIKGKTKFSDARSDAVDMLDCVYERLGLSRGMHETEELARKIESSAVALFAPAAGRSRS